MENNKKVHLAKKNQPSIHSVHLHYLPALMRTHSVLTLIIRAYSINCSYLN